MNENVDLKWMDEKIDHLEKNNFIYKVACFFMGKKLTYKEMLILLKRINEKALGEELSKERSFLEILKIYKYLNNRLPEGIEEFYESK